MEIYRFMRKCVPTDKIMERFVKHDTLCLAVFVRKRTKGVESLISEQ